MYSKLAKVVANRGYLDHNFYIENFCQAVQKTPLGGLRCFDTPGYQRSCVYQKMHIILDFLSRRAKKRRSGDLLVFEKILAVQTFYNLVAKK